MADLNDLLIRIDATTEQLRRELKRAEQSVAGTGAKIDNMGRNIDRRFARIGSSARALASSFGVAFGVAGLGAAVRSVTDAGIAMQRIDRTFKSATGSAEGGAAAFAFVRKEADRLGADLESTASQYAKITAAARGSALEGEGARQIFLGVAEASRVLGWETEQTTGALRAIEQMISKGKVQAEELRGQLGERLPGAFQMAARAMNVTTKELDKMLEQGQVTAEDLLPKLAAELRKTFGPDVAAASEDARAAFNRFNTALFDLRAGIAESGLLDLLADLAERATAVVRVFNEDFFGKFASESDAVRHRIQQIREALAARPEGAVNEWLASLFGAKSNEELRAELAQLTGRLYELQMAAAAAQMTPRAAPAVFAAPTVEGLAKLNRATNEINSAFLQLKNRIAEASRSTTDFIGDTNRINSHLMQAKVALIEFAEDDTFAERFGSMAKSMGSAFEDTLAAAFLGAEQSFGDMLRRMAAQFAASQVMRGLFGALGTALTGPAGAFFSAAVQPRASGGPVSGGRPYLVGEQGPELFVPTTNGSIVANGKMKGGGVTVNNNPTINITATNEREAAERLQSALARNNDRLIAHLASERSRGRF